jgi:hypothetical protein
MKHRKLALRLVFREYIPLIGLLLSWLIAALAISPGDTLRLAAAVFIVAAARAPTILNTNGALLSRTALGPVELRRDVRFAARADIAGLLAGAVLLCLLVLLLLEIERSKVAIFTLFLGIGLPARYLLGGSRSPRQMTVRRLALNWSGVVLILPVLLLDLPDMWAAFAFGLREWAGLAGAKLTRPSRPKALPQLAPTTEALTWSEIAARTYAVSRRRLAFRLAKSLLGATLGPFGGILARTGRGTGAHRHLERFTPRDPRLLGAIAAAATGAGVVMLALSGKPFVALAAASLIRFGASAFASFGWSFFARGHPEAGTSDDEDD